VWVLSADREDEVLDELAELCVLGVGASDDLRKNGDPDVDWDRADLLLEN
jgi:hypothetical protein